MTNNDFTLQQLPLEFIDRCEMGRDDYMVSDCNREAFKLIDAWPRWFGSGLLIYGPKGCGKSHLAHLFADKVKSFYPKPTAVGIINASAINLRNINRLSKEYKVIVIEDVKPQNNNEALFHLFNRFNVEGKYMLWTAQKAATQMSFPLKDLQTRLNMLPCAAISEPDDVMLQMLIVKLFNDRQLTITPEILSYIITIAPRSFEYIEALVAETDKISLAYQRPVNYIIVRRAMEVLQQNNREPDLFDEF